MTRTRIHSRNKFIFNTQSKINKNQEQGFNFDQIENEEEEQKGLSLQINATMPNRGTVKDGVSSGNTHNSMISKNSRKSLTSPTNGVSSL